MIAIVSLAALSMLLFALRHRSPRRAALERLRQIARRAGLDRYTPQSVDREAAAWARRHGGGLQ